MKAVQVQSPKDISDDEYIRLARQGKTPVTEADRKAERNHRNYLRILERDPEYYTRRRRMERRNRNRKDTE